MNKTYNVPVWIFDRYNYTSNVGQKILFITDFTISGTSSQSILWVLFTYISYFRYETF